MNRLHAAVAAALALAAATPAWSKPYAIEPVAAEGQAVRFEAGVPSIESTLSASDAWVSPTARSFDKRMTITVGVLNGGDVAADVDYASVEVYTAEGVRLATYDLAALEKEEKSKAAFAGLAVGLMGGLASAGANRYGYGTSYQPAALASGFANTSASVMTSVNANMETQLAQLGQNILRRTTVAPGQVGGGYVVVQKPPKGTTALRVRVTFAGDIHEFRFDVKG